MKYADHQLFALMKQFECTPRDAKIYLHVLTTGPATIQKIAHDLHENRITIHSAVEKLVAKGLMFESRKGSHRIIAAADPKIFRRLAQKKRGELELMETAIDDAITWLQNVKRTEQSTPSVKFYEGVDGLRYMLEESLESKNEVLVFTFVDLFSKLLNPKYLENYYARRAKLGIRARLIFPSDEFGKRVLAQARLWNMEIKFLPTVTQWRSGFFLWNNIIAIQSFTEGKVTCTIIENEDIAFFFRHVVFSLCWQQAVALPK